MKPLLLLLCFLPITVVAQNLQEKLIGHWSIVEHTVIDTNYNKIKLYKGQVQQHLQFLPDGQLFFTNYRGEVSEGTWKLSKNGKKFQFIRNNNKRSIKTSYKNSDGSHPFMKGTFYTSDRFKFIYPPTIDKYEYGISEYIKTNDSTFAYPDTTKAHEYFQKGKEILSKYADDYNHQGVDYFKKANKLRPNYYWEAYYYIAFFNYGNSKSTLQDISTAIRLHPGDANLYAMRARIHSNYYQHDEALSDINWALIYNPSDPNLFLQRAQILHHGMKLSNQAIFDCNRAIELDTSRADSYYQRAVIYAEMEKIEAACKDFHEAIRLGYSGYIYHMSKCGIKYEDVIKPSIDDSKK